MIPVHIWTHAKALNLAIFPEYFYDTRAGRFTIYDKPILHKRFSRLDYDHAGEFAQTVLNDTGKPSIHIFVITPRDWLQGPYNSVVTDVCQAILDVAWINHRTITLFVNLSGLRSLEAPPDTYALYNISIQSRCSRRPHQAALIQPKNTPNVRTHDFTLGPRYCEQYADPALLPFFRELRDLILCVKLVNKTSPKLSFRKQVVSGRRDQNAYRSHLPGYPDYSITNCTWSPPIPPPPPSPKK